MVTPSAGAIILSVFPFSDLSSSRVRPSVCVADVGRGDWLLCQITSQPYGDLRAVALFDADLQKGSLRVESYARPGKLFSANVVLMESFVGNLKPESFKKIVDAVISIIRPNRP